MEDVDSMGKRRKGYRSAQESVEEEVEVEVTSGKKSDMDDMDVLDDVEENEETEDTDEDEAEAEKNKKDDGPSDDAIKLYLKEIQKTKLLTAEEERMLARRISQGDMAARDRMIESNLRLVVKIAKRYMNRGLPFLDLIEEGNMGLIKAVERFKLSKECRFSTYATWWIRQSIERALVNQSRTIRLPVHVSDDINKFIKISRELIHQYNREPKVEEIAEYMGVEPAYIRRLMVLVKKTYSIEHPMGENRDYSLIDTIEDSNADNPSTFVDDIDKYTHVCNWFATLSESEQEILMLRFGLNDQEPQTLDTIGKRFGVTRERIRQIEAKSLQKLRNIMEERESESVAFMESEMNKRS
jgi:RNA polymerase primary sigma factor